MSYTYKLYVYFKHNGAALNRAARWDRPVPHRSASFVFLSPGQAAAVLVSQLKQDAHCASQISPSSNWDIKVFHNINFPITLICWAGPTAWPPTSPGHKTLFYSPPYRMDWLLSWKLIQGSLWRAGVFWFLRVCGHIFWFAEFIQSVPGGMCNTSGECSLC